MLMICARGAILRRRATSRLMSRSPTKNTARSESILNESSSTVINSWPMAGVRHATYVPNHTANSRVRKREMPRKKTNYIIKQINVCKEKGGLR